MTIEVDIPGAEPLTLEHLLLDQNGTLSDRGQLIDGIADRLRGIRQHVRPHVLSADTFGTLDVLAERLEIDAHRVSSGQDKLRFIRRLGAERCVAIGNGTNDVPMLEAAALGIAVIGPEGVSVEAMLAADVACSSITHALDLMLDPRLLIATLRT
jgi:soluble P-type ATPase